MYRDIVTFIDGAPHTEGVGDCVLQLAATFAAHLTIIGLPRDPGHAMHLANAPAKALKEALHKAQGAAESASRILEERALAAGIPCLHQTFDMPAPDFPQLVTRVSRRFDLSVMPLPSFESFTEDEALFEAALLNSGRPVLGVPRRASACEKFARVMVAWDGGREAARAVGDAMPLLERADLVEIVTIGVDKNPADEELPGCHIAGHLARHGVNCEFRRLDGRDKPAKLLLGRAGELGADLLVMGAYRHSRWRQAVLGGATRDIMQDSKIAVLMSR